MKKLFTLLFFVLAACSVSEDEVRLRLTPILDANLQVIVEDIDTTYLLNEPHYKIVEWKWYEESLYSCNAVVDFYFFRDSSYLIKQKLRFNVDTQLWELYYNEYKSITK